MCKRFPGFLRVGLAEPLPERKFYRRGWVSYRRDVNIKDICWKLNGIRVRLSLSVGRGVLNVSLLHRPLASGRDERR